MSILTALLCTGKTTIAQKFAQELGDDMGLSKAQSGRFVLFISAQDATKGFRDLWAKVNKFCESPIERYISAPFKVVVIDNMDDIPPSHQQGLKKLLEVHFMRTRWIFVASSVDKIIGFLHEGAKVLTTRRLLQKDALLIVLQVCCKAKVGFDREGIQALFGLYRPDLSLTQMIDFAQKVFVERYFISADNVAKVAGKVVEKPKVHAIAAIEPISRCPICTLVPPCKHTSIEKLSSLGLERREALPRFVDGLVCPEFVRYGRCTVFNHHGHCSLDHPKNVHTVLLPPVRCPQCSIPWPCEHCSFSAYRRKLLATVEDVKARLSILKQVSAPDPSLAMVVAMVRMDTPCCSSMLLLHSIHPKSHSQRTY